MPIRALAKSTLGMFPNAPELPKIERMWSPLNVDSRT